MRFLIAILAASQIQIVQPEFSSPPENMPDASQWTMVGGSFNLTANHAAAKETVVGQSAFRHQMCRTEDLPCTFNVRYEYRFEPNDAEDPRTILGQYILWRSGRKAEVFCYAEFDREPYRYFVKHEDQWDELAPGTPEWKIEDDFFVNLLDLDQDQRRPEQQERPQEKEEKPKTIAARISRAGVFM